MLAETAMLSGWGRERRSRQGREEPCCRGLSCQGDPFQPLADGAELQSLFVLPGSQKLGQKALGPCFSWQLGWRGCPRISHPLLDTVVISLLMYLRLSGPCKAFACAVKLLAWDQEHFPL